MLKINQTLFEDAKSLLGVEENNHKNAFEYLPFSKEKSYVTLANNENAVFLSIKITAENGEAEEQKLIENQSYMAMIVCSNRVFNKHKNLFETVSISYKQSLNKLKSEGLFINALIIPETQEELSQKEIDVLEKEISEELKITKSVKSEAVPEEKSIKQTIITNDESNIVELNEMANNHIIEEHDNEDNEDNEYNEEDSLKAEEEALQREFERKRKELEARKKAEAERKEKERLEAERKEKERLEAERKEKERLEAERKEKERLEAERKEKERLEAKEKLANEVHKKESSKDNNIDNFIKSFAPSEYKKYEGKQKEAYERATDSTPFLNTIDTYIPESNIHTLEAPAPIYEIHEEDEFIQTTASKTKLRSTFAKVVSFFMDSEHISLKKVLIGDLDINQFMIDVKAYIEKNCQIPVEDMPMFLNKLKNAFFSYYVLIPAINDPKITDIKVLSADNINVKVNGEHFTASDLKFINDSDYLRFLEMLIIKNRATIPFNDILLFTDKDFHPDYILRFNVSLPGINSTGMPYIHIRKVPKEKVTMKDLIKAEMFDEKIACYLLDKIVTSRGIVFAGPSASGKTTLLNAMIDYIPKNRTIDCTQESEELFSNIHPAAYFQHIKKDTRGNIVVGLSELGQNGLVCDAEYFIIGECKNAEARDMLRASNTGHKCWCTVHSQSAGETISRLADYVKEGSDYSFKEASRMLKDLEVIVYIQNFKIMEITEIVGYDEDKERLIYRPIYRREV